MIPSPHIPVLLEEVLAALAPRSGGTYVDATYGAGGYTRAILARAACRVVGIDRDPDVLTAANSSALPAGLTLAQGRFGDMDSFVEGPVDGIAFDIGVSSMQIDQPERGFSFRFNGPLDMRMGREGRTAADIVNTEEEAALADMIYLYGEERHARRVARAIVAARAESAIETTERLASVVRRAIRAVSRKGADEIDPATRTFQALRIVVNEELTELENGLAAAERLLRPGGRLVVVTFHSLEDRIAKTFLRERSGSAGGGSRHVPVTAQAPQATFRLLDKRPVVAGASELAVNPRARSAKLRAAERTEAPAWPVAA